MAETPPIGGTTDARFAAVADAFAANFTERGEIGASVCVTVEGRTVVDLWGGWADPDERRPWQADTLVNAFSVGKGFVALLAARLLGQGRLDVDATVASVWPEFGQAGKSSITIRQLLSHQAGLPAFHQPMPDDAIYDWAAMTAALAAEEPWWTPGEIHGYHVNTYGFLAGEVLRRITGDSPGRLLRELVAGPLGADVHLGLAATDDPRTATFVWPDFSALALEPPPPGEPAADHAAFGIADPIDADPIDAMRYAAYFNPSTFSGAGIINTRAWRGAEMPSTNTHASARGVTRIYAALVGGGTLDGVTVVDPAALAAATAEQVDGLDIVLDRPSRFGLGFQLAQPDRPLGPDPRGFGHFGAGGSLGFADPASGVAFGYVMNRIGSRWQNPCNQTLRDAVFAALT